MSPVSNLTQPLWEAFDTRPNTHFHVFVPCLGEYFQVLLRYLILSWWVFNEFNIIIIIDSISVQSN